MIRAFLNRLTLIFATLIVGVVSIYSAERMAPGPADQAAAAFWVANGASLDDLCKVDGQAGGHWHCPFCHKLGDTPVLALSPRVDRLALIPAWQALGDVLLGPQHGNPNVSARAPPALA